MMNRLLITIIVCSMLSLSGCGPATVKRAEKLDQTALDSKQLVELVSGNSLVLSAYDFNGTLYFDPSGLLSAIDNRKQRDTGSWDVNDQNQLCLKFRVWYYSDAKCYQVFDNEQAEKLTFFTSNGAAYYTATRRNGDPDSLAAHIGKQSPPRSVRTQFTGEAAGGSSSDTQQSAPQSPGITISSSDIDDAAQTVKRLAGDCPGCKMAGIDLREASLIKANLEEADLSGADLRYANLRRANLKGANLRGARLTHANLPGADLSGADLTDCDLTGANLLLANLTDAVTTGAQFLNANLERTIGLKTQ